MVSVITIELEPCIFVPKPAVGIVVRELRDEGVVAWFGLGGTIPGVEVDFTMLELEPATTLLITVDVGAEELTGFVFSAT